MNIFIFPGLICTAILLSSGVEVDFDGGDARVGKVNKSDVISGQFPTRPATPGSTAAGTGPRTESVECVFGDSSEASANSACSTSDAELEGILDCTDDEVVVRPYWVREEQPDGTWTDLQQVGTFGCGTPQQAAQVATLNIAEVVEREFQNLPIVPSSVQVQPGSGWTFVNVPTIVFSAGDPQTLQTTVLGTSVEVEVTPQQFSWDFGDGSQPLVTSDPGQPYPGHTLAHTYSATGTRTIALTTSWSGQFRAAGSGTWRTINGTATTVSSSDPLEVHEAQARLVVEDLN